MESLRDKARRVAAAAVGKIWDEPLLKALGVKLYANTVSVKLTAEQARVVAKLDEIFEDEAQALRAVELEAMRGCA